MRRMSYNEWTLSGIRGAPDTCPVCGCGYRDMKWHDPAGSHSTSFVRSFRHAYPYADSECKQYRSKETGEVQREAVASRRPQKHDLW